MNYLAHLHIANHVGSSLLGNLLGDFVKGTPPDHLGLVIQQGISLHRHVDKFTDQHPVSKEIKAYFEPQVRRYVPIALDMFWDHCLANDWENYHSLSLDAFVCESQREIESEGKNIELPVTYVNVSEKLWSQQWLQSYQSFDNICYAIERISMRRQRLNGLVHCIDGLEQHYAEISDKFTEFYPDVLKESKRHHCLVVV